MIVNEVGVRQRVQFEICQQQVGVLPTQNIVTSVRVN